MTKILLFILAVFLSGYAASLQAQPAKVDEQANFEKLFQLWQKERIPVRTIRPRQSISQKIDKMVISSVMGMRLNPVTGRRMLHAGMDIVAPQGAAVHATADGQVMQAGPVGSYGLLVTVAHEAGYETRYAHMSRIMVVPGAVVRKGDIVGYVGSTGRSTGPHLHYEIRRFGRAMDPSSSVGK